MKLSTTIGLHDEQEKNECAEDQETEWLKKGIFSDRCIEAAKSAAKYYLLTTKSLGTMVFHYEMVESLQTALKQNFLRAQETESSGALISSISPAISLKVLNQENAPGRGAITTLVKGSAVDALNLACTGSGRKQIEQSVFAATQLSHLMILRSSRIDVRPGAIQLSF